MFHKASTSQTLKQKVTELQDYEAFHEGEAITYYLLALTRKAVAAQVPDSIRDFLSWSSFS